MNTPTAIAIGKSPQTPNIPAKTDTSIHRAMNGELTPSVTIINPAAVAVSSIYIASDDGKADSFGIHIYDTKLSIAVIEANINMGNGTIIDSLILWPINGKKYSIITAVETNKLASHMRRCQKRVKLTSCMLPPTSNYLVNIMKLVVLYCK